MKKCFKCGHEFDGVFCPQCGTKYEKEKTCPNCQAAVDGGVKFCNYCGYSFEQADTSAIDAQQAKTNRSAITASNSFWSVLAKILQQVSVYVFALFSLLLWAFFAAPFATIFGESFGNVYSTINGTFDDFLSIAQASIAFAVISLVYAIVTITLKFVPSTSNVTVGKFKLTQILSLGSNILYIPFVVLGCETINKANELGMENGSYVAVVIAFSIIFAVISVGALVADFLLRRRIAAYSNAVSTNNQAKIERDEQRRKLKAERRANAKQILTERNIIEPAYVERPNKKLSTAIAKAYKYNIWAWAIGILVRIVPMIILVFSGVARFRDTSQQIFYMAIYFVELVLWSLILWFFTSNSKTYRNNQSKMAIVIILIVALILCNIVNAVYSYIENYRDLPVLVQLLLFATSLSFVGLTMSLLYSISVSNNVTDEGYLQGATIRKYKRFSIANLILSIVVLFSGLWSDFVSSGYLDFLVSLGELLFGLIPIVLFVVNITRCNGINKTFGINGKTISKLQVVDNEQGEKSLLTLDVFCAQLHNYDLYCEDKRYYDASVNRVVCNRELIDKNAHIKNSNVFRTIIALLAAVTLLTIGIMGTVKDANDIFKTSKVERINYTESYYDSYRTSKDEVVNILGKADVETNYVWTYYSDNYVKKLNEIETLNEQMANAESLEQAFKIQEQIDKVKKEMQNMEYKYIIVTFDDEGKAIDVKYDFHYNPSKNAESHTSYGVFFL